MNREGVAIHCHLKHPMGGLSIDPDFRQPTMDKKAKKKIQALNQRIQKLRQQLAGARKQMDDPQELKTFEEQLAAAEAEVAKLKGA